MTPRFSLRSHIKLLPNALKTGFQDRTFSQFAKELDPANFILEVRPVSLPSSDLHVLVGLLNEVGSSGKSTAHGAGTIEMVSIFFFSPVWAVWSCSFFVQPDCVMRPIIVRGHVATGPRK